MNRWQAWELPLYAALATVAVILVVAAWWAVSAVIGIQSPAERQAAIGTAQAQENNDLLLCLLVVHGDDSTRVDDDALRQRCERLAEERRRQLDAENGTDDTAGEADQPERAETPPDGPEAAADPAPPTGPAPQPPPPPSPAPEPSPQPPPPPPDDPEPGPEPGPVERVCDLIGVCP